MTSQNWEEEFMTKHIYNEFQTFNGEKPTCWHTDWHKVEEYIRTLLSNDRQSLREKIEGMKIEFDNSKIRAKGQVKRYTRMTQKSRIFGYNQALSDTLTLLNDHEGDI